MTKTKHIFTIYLEGEGAEKWEAWSLAWQQAEKVYSADECPRNVNYILIPGDEEEGGE